MAGVAEKYVRGLFRVIPVLRCADGGTDLSNGVDQMTGVALEIA